MQFALGTLVADNISMSHMSRPILDGARSIDIYNALSATNSLQHLLHPVHEEQQKQIVGPLHILNHFKVHPVTTNAGALRNNLQTLNLRRHHTKPGKTSIFGASRRTEETGEKVITTSVTDNDKLHTKSHSPLTESSFIPASVGRRAHSLSSLANDTFGTAHAIQPYGYVSGQSLEWDEDCNLNVIASQSHSPLLPALTSQASDYATSVRAPSIYISSDTSRQSEAEFWGYPESPSFTPAGKRGSSLIESLEPPLNDPSSTDYPKLPEEARPASFMVDSHTQPDIRSWIAIEDISSSSRSPSYQSEIDFWNVPRTESFTLATDRDSSIIEELEGPIPTDGTLSPHPLHENEQQTFSSEQLAVVVTSVHTMGDRVINKVLADQSRLRMRSVSVSHFAPTRITLATPPPLCIQDEIDAKFEASDGSEELNHIAQDGSNQTVDNDDDIPSAGLALTQAEFVVAGEVDERCSEPGSLFNDVDDRVETSLPTPESTPPPFRPVEVASPSTSSPSFTSLEFSSGSAAPISPVPPTLPSPAPSQLASPVAPTISTSFTRNFIQTTHKKPRQRKDAGPYLPRRTSGERSPIKLEPSPQKTLPRRTLDLSGATVKEEKKPVKEEKTWAKEERKAVKEEKTGPAAPMAKQEEKKKHKLAPSDRAAAKAQFHSEHETKRRKVVLRIEEQVAHWANTMNRYIYLAERENKYYRKHAESALAILHEIDARKGEISRELFSYGEPSLARMLRKYCHKTAYFDPNLKSKARELREGLIKRFGLVDPNQDND